MPVTARSLICALCFGAILTAGPPEADEVSSLLLDLSTSLQEGNAARFLSHIDHRLKDYAVLEDNVVAMTAQDEVASSVAVLEQRKTSEGYDFRLDWLLELKTISGDKPAERRRSEVSCRIKRSGKQWKISALAPVTFFRPL
jgi:hypothetical protein